MLRMRHMPFRIGPTERDHWLANMSAAVAEVCADRSPTRRRRRADGVLPSRPPNTCATTPECRSRRPRTASGSFAPRWPPSRCDGCARRTGRSSPSTTCRSTCRRARCTRSSGTTAPGSRRRSRSSRGTVTAPPVTCRCSARTREHGGRELRDRIGIVLQSSGIESELYVGEALELYGSCYRRRRDVDDVLELVGLAALAGQRIGTLSGGQRRRIDLALGIIGRPELLFLDEPTTGFDPAARRRSWELIGDLCGEGTTVSADHPLPRRGGAPRRSGRRAEGRSPDRRGHPVRADPHGDRDACVVRPPRRDHGRRARRRVAERRLDRRADGSSSRPRRRRPRSPRSPVGPWHAGSSWRSCRSRGRRSRTCSWISSATIAAEGVASDGAGR